MSSADRVRLTKPTLGVIDALQQATVDGPLYGLQICRLTDLGPGTVYPILDRLVRAGWIHARWEANQPAGRPRRCFYEITATGRLEIAQARAARTARNTRWSAPPVKPAIDGGGGP
jgi:predicted transcriptional regulator